MNPDAYTLTFASDAADRSTATTFPDGTSQTSVYDRLDLARQKDRANRWSLTSYDAARACTRRRTL
jgi:YD repeat-containing protein